MTTNPFKMFFAKFARFGSRLKDKPTVEIDDYELEHILLYHGLVGSTPENQSLFKDVKANIRDAVNHRSSFELGIALKFSPLIYEERLQRFVAELDQNTQETLADLILANDNENSLEPESRPLDHPDWRARANAAILLSALDCKKGVKKLCRALVDSADSAKTAFCHIARALQKLDTHDGRDVLKSFLSSPEPWFRVDSAAALASSPPASVKHSLAESALWHHDLHDYMCYSIAAKFPLNEFLESGEPDLENGGVEIVAGLLKASEGNFGKEIVHIVPLASSIAKTAALCLENPNPIRMAAVLSIFEWLEKNRETLTLAREESEKLGLARRSVLESKQTESILFDYFKSGKPETDDPQLRASLVVAGLIRLPEVSPLVRQLLDPRFAYLNEALDCLGQLGEPESAPHVVSLVEKIVDLNSRCSDTLSAHAIVEEDRRTSKIYWSALKALGKLPHESGLKVLRQCISDKAADKREVAFRSLASTCLNKDVALQFKEEWPGLVQKGLNDPATCVRMVALEIIEEQRLINLLPNVIRLVPAREASLSRQANRTISALASSGHRDLVQKALESNLASALDFQTRDRLRALLTSIYP